MDLGRFSRRRAMTPIARNALLRTELLFLLFTCMRCLPTVAQEVTPSLRIADITGGTQFQSEGPTALSADGLMTSYAACSRGRIGIDTLNSNGRAAWSAATRQGCRVYVTSTETGKTVLALPGESNSWGPSWSPDSRTLAFYADQGGRLRVWTWDRTSNSAQQRSNAVAQTGYNGERPAWTPDGRQLLIKLKHGMPDKAEARPRPSRSTVSLHHDIPARAVTTTAVVYRSSPLEPRKPHESTSGEGGAAAVLPPDNEWLGDLALLDVSTGKTSIVAPGVRSNWYDVAPTGDAIAFLDFRGRREVSSKDSTPTFSTYESDLVVVDLPRVHTRVVATRVHQWRTPSVSWSPDGRWLAYLSGSRVVFPDSRATYGVHGNLYVVPSRGGTGSTLMAPGQDMSSQIPLLGTSLLWDGNGEHVYLTDSQQILRASIATKRITPLTLVTSVKPDVIVQAADGFRIWSPKPGGSLYFMGTDSVTLRGSINRVSLTTGVLTSLQEGERQNYTSYQSPPIGSHVSGAVVFRSMSATEAQDLWLAEGDLTRSHRLTRLNPQLTSYVLGRSRLLDFRSSDGEKLRAALLLPNNYVIGQHYPLATVVYAGMKCSNLLNAFGLLSAPESNMQVLSTSGYAVLCPDMPVHTGTVLQDLMKTVMPAIDRVVDLGIADPDRLAVMGQSNGGYSTLGLLVQTRRFQAAVVSAGFGNLVSFYGAMSPNGDGTWISYLESASGGMGAPPWEVPQRYVENSPIFYLDRVHTPLTMFAGSADGEIAAGSDEIFVGLKRLRREVTYVRYQGEGHSLSLSANIVDYWSRVLAFYDARL